MFQSKSETQCATCTVVGEKKSSDFPQIISNMAMRYFWKHFLGFKKFSSIKLTQIIFLSRRNMDGVVYMQTGACGLKTCE